MKSYPIGWLFFEIIVSKAMCIFAYLCKKQSDETDMIIFKHTKGMMSF